MGLFVCCTHLVLRWWAKQLLGPWGEAGAIACILTGLDLGVPCLKATSTGNVSFKNLFIFRGRKRQAYGLFILTCRVSRESTIPLALVFLASPLATDSWFQRCQYAQFSVFLHSFQLTGLLSPAHCSLWMPRTRKLIPVTPSKQVALFHFYIRMFKRKTKKRRWKGESTRLCKDREDFQFVCLFLCFSWFRC